MLTALAIPIIIFYMLKLRRQPARVSSLMLWQQVLQDRQANAPWQRLRRNLLLLLQLLILALLVMALARPYFTVQARVQGNVVLLLDASASMQATDVAPSRFEAAKEAAADVISRLDPDDAVTLIAVAGTPRILASATGDPGTLRRALDAAQPSNGPADWDSALTLAAANATTLPDATVVVISDGGLTTTDTGQQTTDTFPVPVQFIGVGETANNQGLVALSLRDGREGPEVFLRVFNAAAEPVERLVELWADGQRVEARRLDIPAQASASLTLAGLPLTTRQVEARLNGEDALPADDRAWAVRSAAPRDILIVGAGNLFLERALALLPGVTIQRAAPDQTLPETPFDLLIFDRTAPPTDSQALDGSNLLFIAPPASTDLFEVGGVITQTRISRMRGDDPLLAYVELNNLQVARAQAVSPPPWARTLIEARGGPLLLAGQREGQRIAILTFDLHQSDLPLQIDFPILTVNLARWLLPGDNLAQGQTLPAEQSITLPAAASADALLIRPPSGDPLTVPSDQATFNQTGDLGIYQILADDPAQEEPALLTQFAVNLLSEAESNIQPRQLDSSEAGATPAEQSLTGRWEWWWLLVLLGLAVLLVEWWIYWRGDVR